MIYSGFIVSFKWFDGKDVQGYLVKLVYIQGVFVIVVIQEWWGLNDQICGVVDCFVCCGYFVLVFDFYCGKSMVEEEEVYYLMEGFNFVDVVMQDIVGVVVFLCQYLCKVGFIGFCMGGVLMMFVFGQGVVVDVGVMWYGMLLLEYIDVGKIIVLVFGYWVMQDEFFFIDNVDKLEVRFKDVGVSVEFYCYFVYYVFVNEMVVGFGCISCIQYDLVWVEYVWDCMFMFFGCMFWL